MRRWLASGLFVVGLVLLPASVASAHPLGNFTVNTYSGLRLAPDRISLDFVVDMAEIPTLQRMHDLDPDRDGTATPSELLGYAEQECPQLIANLSLRVDGRPLTLEAKSAEATTPSGQAGLRTLRLTCTMDAPTGGIGADGVRVSFANSNFTDRVGWREVTAIGDGATLLSTDVPRRSVSQRLTNYPQDLLASPFDQRTASLLVRPGGAAAGKGEGSTVVRSTPLPRGVDRATSAFTSFVSRHDVTLGFAVLALLSSLVLGAIHALAPGHGKTVMAAYLVGQRGSFRDAMVIALTVTATHTVGVLALGIAISASAIVAPERLYPWLGAASGALLAAIGAGFLVRLVRVRRQARSGHDHAHEHPHVHSHGGRPHTHGPLATEQLVTWRGLVAMGFVGGLLPSPSAVVVLLGAIALGRIWFGVLLVIVYGLGMAATLAGAGVLLIRARGACDRLLGSARRNRFLLRTSRLVPSATGVFITLVGAYLTAHSAAQI